MPVIKNQFLYFIYHDFLKFTFFQQTNNKSIAKEVADLLVIDIEILQLLFILLDLEKKLPNPLGLIKKDIKFLHYMRSFFIIINK